MPASKTARAQERKRIINRRVRSSSRTAVKKAVGALAAGAPEAPEAVALAISALDRAASKGGVHRNNVARRKSRLMKRLNKASE